MLTKLYTRAQNALAKDDGATMVEYGLLVALIAVALILTITAMKDGLAGLFQDVTAAL